MSDRLLTHKERLDLAVCYFGLYTFGLATTPKEIVDEQCAMDNCGVPFLESLLNEKQKQILEKLSGK